MCWFGKSGYTNPLKAHRRQHETNVDRAYATDGSLQFEADAADDAHVYRDGASAIVSVDSGSNLRPYGAAYRPPD